LKVLRRLAEDELRTVGGAVITVPAYFDDAQRQATKDAGKLAGLDVLRLLNEPTAAALAYGLEKKRDGLFAVYDLGGGTFDVTILLLEDGVFQVKSTGGDSALGGDDMDRAIAERLFAQLGGREARRRARAACGSRSTRPAAAPSTRSPTRARSRSSCRSTPGGVKRLLDDRDEFDALVAPIVERTGVACRRALRDAGCKPRRARRGDPGGRRDARALRAHLREELFGKEPLADIDPDQVVALGAALQADMLAGSRSDEVLLLDVLPLSLGIETMGGVVEKILPRNTTIPTGARRRSRPTPTTRPASICTWCRASASWRPTAARSREFVLKGIPPMPAGLARLEVTFRVDADGLLGARARADHGHRAAGRGEALYGLTDDEVEAMLMAALDHGERRSRGAPPGRGARRGGARRARHARRPWRPTPICSRTGERERIDEVLEALEAALGSEQGPPGKRASVIQARASELDDATHDVGRQAHGSRRRAAPSRGAPSTAWRRAWRGPAASTPTSKSTRRRGRRARCSPRSC
jgi:molecular chaperone HscA